MIQDVYAENYTLPIFEGQGVRHALGYGVVTHVPQSGLSKVTVRFESGAELVCERENLRPALMPEAELEFIRAKYNLSSDAGEEGYVDESDEGEEEVDD